MHIDGSELMKASRSYTALRERAIRYAWCTAGVIALAGFAALSTLCAALARTGADSGLWALILGAGLAVTTWRIACGALLPELMRLDMALAHDRLQEATRAAVLRRGLDLLPGWKPADITRGRLTVVDSDGRQTKAHISCQECRLGVVGHFGDGDPELSNW